MIRIPHKLSTNKLPPEQVAAKVLAQVNKPKPMAVLNFSAIKQINVINKQNG